jgi:MYXO-CTERM domain-containing protein
MVEGKTTVEVTGAADTIFLALLALIGVAGYLGARRRD